MKIIKLGAEWCQPCHMVEPLLQSVSKEVGADYINVDIDHPGMYEDLIAEVGISSIPVVVFQADGREDQHLVGTQQKITYLNLAKAMSS
jgi:thioredoxin 1